MPPDLAAGAAPRGIAGFTHWMRWAEWPRWVQLALGLAVAYSVAHLLYSICAYTIFSVDMYRSRDFHRVFVEAVEWKRTGVPPALGSVLYPPFYYLLLWPLAGIEFRTLTYVLYFIQFLYFPIAVAVMVKAVAPAASVPRSAYVLAAVLTVNFQPFLETLAQHKVEGLELVLVALAIYEFRRGRDRLAGALIGLAANLKYLPGILVAYFVLKREWKVLQGVALGLGACLMVLVPVLGLFGVWDYWLSYPFTFLFGQTITGTGPEANLEWQNLSGAINRWFAGPAIMVEHFRTQGNARFPNSAPAIWLAGALKAACGVGYAALLWRTGKIQDRRARWPLCLIELSLTLLLISVFASASRVHYAVLFLPAFVGTALLLLSYPQVFGMKERVLWALAYALTAMLIPGGVLNRLPPHPLWGAKHSFAYMWMSLPFYGHVLLAASLWCCHRSWRRHALTAGDS